MGRGNVNCNHFTGKKKPCGSRKKRVVRPKQEPHKKQVC